MAAVLPQSRTVLGLQISWYLMHLTYNAGIHGRILQMDGLDWPPGAANIPRLGVPDLSFNP